MKSKVLEVRRMAKDPMFVGAMAGLFLGLLMSAHIALWGFPRGFLKLVFYGTYYGDGLVYLWGRLRLTRSFAPLAISGYIFLWYIQYGFFMGLFYKLLRKKLSRGKAICILITIIIVFFYALYISNASWGEYMSSDKLPKI